MRAARHAAWLLLLIPACFHPSYDHPHCGPNRECPSGLTCSAQLVCEALGEGKVDASIDTPAVPPDALICFGTGIVKVCLAAAPTQPLMISSAITIDTATSSLCVPTVSGGSGYCVIAATSINIGATLRATGTMPLVLVASDSISTSATIDVGSHRGANPETGAGADPATCVAGTVPGAAGGGGAGGTFLGLGGKGGTGGKGGAGGVASAPIGTVTELRGGCLGQSGGGGSNGGAKGHGGGAVFLIAGNKIILTGGGVNAAGEGGGGAITASLGGGGGGAGGMIGFDAPLIMGTGLILASGGGGGEGAGVVTAGNAGADPNSVVGAPGGAGNTNTGGDGGDGSSGVAAGSGVAGKSGSMMAGSEGGGGGGGGGAGLIKAPAGANLGTQVSPPPTP